MKLDTRMLALFDAGIEKAMAVRHDSEDALKQARAFENRLRECRTSKEWTEEDDKALREYMQTFADKSGEACIKFADLKMSMEKTIPNGAGGRSNVAGIFYNCVVQMAGAGTPSRTAVRAGSRCAVAGGEGRRRSRRFRACAWKRLQRSNRQSSTIAG